MSEIVDIEPLMRGLYEEMQTGGENYSTQSVYEMIEKETSKVEVFTKADMVAMLTEIQLEIEELDSMVIYDGDAIGSIGIPIFSTNYIRKKKVNNIIQQKINELKENSEKQKNRKCACYDCKHFDRKGMSHCTIHEDSYGDTRCFDYKENKE